ncbi:hypothetical protein PISMIDRAFT_340197 [Pisolithus microcarpus 441]|uniref:Uncharacterized protein n=1 Tax=Pisolithus microcarpus 441 TaxID=765257 RepID=A0A0C9ZTH9_9AGAM|nr:hypothetical protein PISMIDRAFT_340197 [Pisolithus microcarpus 441]
MKGPRLGIFFSFFNVIFSIRVIHFARSHIGRMYVQTMPLRLLTGCPWDDHLPHARAR